MRENGNTKSGEYQKLQEVSIVKYHSWYLLLGSKYLETEKSLDQVVSK